MLRADLSVGLGTDSAASNNTLNLWAEMKAAALLQKGLHGSDAIDAYTVVELATIRAAHAIGKEKLIGSLEVGKRADIIVVTQDQLHQLPIYEIPSQLVYASYPADVTMVMIDGRVVMKGGRLMTLRDEAMLREKTEFYRERIRGEARRS
jgi:5-methylthioadenosine/S-adenosylhomocysteine deaminase